MQTPTDQQYEDLATEILEHYTSVLNALKKPSMHPNDTMESIRPRMLQIQIAEKKISPLRSEYISGAKTCTESCQQVIDRTTSTLEAMIPLLEELGNRTRESLASLFPNIQKSVQGLEMKIAYSERAYR